VGNIPYSASKVDLLYPARNGNFFTSGPPATEAALCAEMVRMAYCRVEPQFSFDRDQMHSILEPMGFTCRFFETAGAPEGMGTHGFLAFHVDSDPSKNLAIVSFRGTDAADPTDLASDAAFLQTDWLQGGMVHRGFAEALDHILADLKAAVDQCKGRVLYTGHSLGAALATLFATVRPPDFLYTFGSPRVGNAEFVSAMKKVNHHRFVHCCDIVARIPPEKVAEVTYEHCGRLYYIERNGLLSREPDDGVMEKDRIIAAADYVVDYSWRIGNVAVRELADHAPINYVTALAADASQPKLMTWKST
jgi:Lipase (class 3)